MVKESKRRNIKKAVDSKKEKKVTTTTTIRKANFGRGPRLYVKAIFAGFRRGRHDTKNNNQALLKIEGLNDRKEAQYYLGKRVVYIYKNKSGFQSIWGRISAQHGNNGTVKAIFNTRLPPRAIGCTIRVMLYPVRKTA